MKREKQREDDIAPSRRKVLQFLGTSAVAAGALSTAVTASEDGLKVWSSKCGQLTVKNEADYGQHVSIRKHPSKAYSSAPLDGHSIDAGGSHTFTGLKGGKYDVYTNHDGQHKVATVRVSCDKLKIWSPECGKLTVKNEADYGQHVSIRKHPSRAYSSAPLDGHSLDANGGTHTFTGLKGGKYDVYTNHGGQHLVETVEVESCKRSKKLMASSPECGTLKVRNKADYGQHVSIRKHPSKAYSSTPIDSHSIDAGGSHTFTGLKGGKYDVYSNRGGQHRVTTVEVDRCEKKVDPDKIELKGVCVDKKDDLAKFVIKNRNERSVELRWKTSEGDRGKVTVGGNSSKKLVVETDKRGKVTVRLYYKDNKIEKEDANRRDRCDLGDDNDHDDGDDGHKGIKVTTGRGEGDEAFDTGDEKWKAYAHYGDNSSRTDGEVGIGPDGKESVGGCGWHEGEWSDFTVKYDPRKKSATIHIDNVRDDGPRDTDGDEDETYKGRGLKPDGDQLAVTVQARWNGKTCVKNLRFNGKKIRGRKFCVRGGTKHIMISNAPTDEKWTLTGKMSFKDFGKNPRTKNPRVRVDVA